MSRINTSHQAIAAKQRNCNYHPSGAIAQHILDTTIYDESLTEQVILKDGQYLVASNKFAHRYYVVAEIEGCWVCSSKEASAAQRCIAQVHAYRAGLLVA